MSETLIKKLKDYLDEKPNYEKFVILYDEMSYDLDFIKNLYPNELKTFQDLKFKPHKNNFYDTDKGVQALLNFDNNHYVSVIGGSVWFYGDGVNTFEVGYPLPDDSIDVAGWLTPEEVTEFMFKIQMRKPLKNESPQ